MNKYVLAVLVWLGYDGTDLSNLIHGHPHASPAATTTTKGSLGDIYTAPSTTSFASATSTISTSTSTSTAVPNAGNPRTSNETYPAVGACSGNCSFVHDPSIIVRPDGTYVRFSTFNKISIATAPNIRGPWTEQGSALPAGSSINKPGRNVLWAPDVFPLGDTYYMFYAVSVSGSQDSDIGVATSKTLDAGDWKDHGSIGIPDNKNWNKIDPNLFQHDPKDPLLLSFGSYWQGLYQIPMASPPVQIDKNAVAAHLEYNGTVRPDNLPVDANEGSYQFWWNVNGKDYFYLFWSAGDCCSQPPNLPPQGEEYKIMVCRSESPNGGFEGVIGWVGGRGHGWGRECGSVQSWE